jgi:hypothetical protein
MCGVCSVLTVHYRVAMMIRNRIEGSVETGDETDLMPEPRVVSQGEGAARLLSLETSSSEESGTDAREPRWKRRWLSLEEGSGKVESRTGS